MDVRRALRMIDDDLSRRWLFLHDEIESVVDIRNLKEAYIITSEVPEQTILDTRLRIHLFTAGNYLLGMVRNREKDGRSPAK